LDAKPVLKLRQREHVERRPYQPGQEAAGPQMSGLEDGDVVVTEGHLLLTNGARVTVRERKAGA